MSEDNRKAEPGKRASLGRGLSALFGEANEDFAALDRSRQAKDVPIEYLRPGKYQPRHVFDEEAIGELALSIREKGILQPILVRKDPTKSNSFEIIAGERRWRAAQIAGVHQVPVIIRDLTDREALEVSIIENVQRRDLLPLEEGEGYKKLLEEFQHTQEELAKIVGKSRSHITNTLRLLTLPEEVKSFVNDESLSAGHARALLAAPNPVELARHVINNGLNVRQTEQLVRDQGQTKGSSQGGSIPEKDADVLNLEKTLSEQLGLRVQIKSRAKGGDVVVSYKTIDQLDEILRRLTESL